MSASCRSCLRGCLCSVRAYAAAAPSHARASRQIGEALYRTKCACTCHDAPRGRLACAAARRAARSIAGSDRRLAHRRRDALSGALARAAPNGAPSPSTSPARAIRRRHHRRGMRPLHERRRRSAIRRAVARGTAGDRRSRTRISSRRQQAGLTAEQVPRLDAEMGVRISGHDVRVGAADHRRRPPVRRQPERHRLLARRRRPAASSGRSRRDGGVRASISIGDGAARISPDQKGYAYALDADDRHGSSGRRKVDDHPLIRLTGSPDAVRRPALRADVVVRRSREEPPAYAVLHLPRQHRRARREHRRRACGGRYTIAEEPKVLGRRADGVEMLGARRRRDLVGADDRRQARRRCTSASATRMRDRHAAGRERRRRVRSRDRAHALGEAGARRRTSSAAASANRTAATVPVRTSTSASSPALVTAAERSRR